MKAETLEAYRPLLRRILDLEGFRFENVFSFRVKGEDIVDALSGKSQFFDIGTKGNRLLKSLYQQWKQTQRPASVLLKDHVMSIFPISEDVDGMDFLGMLREREDGEFTLKEETLILLLCSMHATGAAPVPATAETSPTQTAEIRRLEEEIAGERQTHQKEIRQALIRTRELEENLRVAEENVSSFQKLAEELQSAAAREHQLRMEAEEQLRARESASVPPEARAPEELSQLLREKEDLSGRLLAVEAELADARTTVERIDEERMTESVQHSNEIETLMSDLSQTQLRERELASRVEELERHAADARQRVEAGGASTTRIGELEKEVKEARTRESRLASELEQVQDELSQEKEITARTFSELEQARNERDDFELRYEAFESEAIKLRAVASEVDQLRKQVEELKGERDSLSFNQAALDAEISVLRQQTEETSRRLDEAAGQRDRLAAERETLERVAATAREMRDRVETLEESLQLMDGRFQESSDLLGTVMKSRDKYRMVLDSQINPMFLLDRNLVILHLNRAMLSYTQEHQFPQIIGKRCYEALGLPGICHGCPILKSVETGQLEGNLVNMDMVGEHRLFSISAYPTLDKEANVSVITEFMEEVTDRVAAMEQLKRLNAERQKILMQAEASPLAYLRLLLETVGTRAAATGVHGDELAVKSPD